MDLFTKARHIGVSVAVVATAALLIGCGGGGGGGSSTNGGSTGTKATQLVKNNGTFEGTIGAPAGIAASRGNAAPQTTFTVRFDDTVGAATFKSGTYGDTDFVSYSADISNIVVTPNGTGESGAISFDMTNFTSGSPYTSLHWAGNYQWNKVEGSGAAMTITGTITGTGTNGAVNSSFSMSYFWFPNIVAFTGNWTGDITIPSLPTQNWTGTFSTIDATHTNVSIHYGNDTITVPTVTTNNALAGEFDGSAFVEGAQGHFYMERDPAFNDNNHLIGGYTVTLGGAPLGGGVIHALRSTTPTPVSLTTNLYKGTFTPNGGSAQELTLDFLHISSNVGMQGAALFNPTGNPLYGARILTVSSNTTSTTVTLSNLGLTQVSPSLSGKYSGISLIGSPTATGFSGSYTANLTAGGNESGTFTTTKQTNVTRLNIDGNWSGSAKGANGTGTANTFSGHISMLEDEFSFSATQKVSGSNVTFTVSGFIVGDSFVGNAVNQPITVSGISGTYTGHFEGTVSGNGQTITGEFFYTATAPGLGSFSDNGTFTLTKQ